MGKKYELPPLIFFETHADNSVTSFIIENLAYFLKVGYRAICIEVEVGLSLETIMKVGQVTLKKALTEIGLLAPNSDSYEIILSQLRTVGGKQLFFLHIKETSLQFRGIDLSVEKLKTNLNSIERNETLATNIIKTAMEFNGGIIAILGFGHCIVQQMIRDMDMDHASQYLWYHIHNPVYSTPARNELVKSYEHGGYKTYFPLGLKIFEFSNPGLFPDFKIALSEQCYTYDSKELDTATVRTLQHATGEAFSAHLRTDGEIYVDATLPIEATAKNKNISPQSFLHNLSTTLKSLSYEIEELSSISKEKKSYVIIRGINTQEVAETIKNLPVFSAKKA